MRKVSAGRACQRVPELLTVAEWMCTVTALCVTALRALPRRVLLMQAKRASLSPPSSEILGLTGMPPSMLRNVGLRAAAAASAASAPSSSQCHAHQAPQRRKPKSNVDGGERAEGSYAYTGGHEVSPDLAAAWRTKNYFSCMARVRCWFMSSRRHSRRCRAQNMEWLVADMVAGNIVFSKTELADAANDVMTLIDPDRCAVSALCCKAGRGCVPKCRGEHALARAQWSVGARAAPGGGGGARARLRLVHRRLVQRQRPHAGGRAAPERQGRQAGDARVAGEHGANAWWSGIGGIAASVAAR